MTKRVVIAGSVNMDVVATAPCHPRIGESVIGSALDFIPGGKGANQAVAAAKSGAKTVLMGKVGEDSFAGPLLEFLQNSGVELMISRSKSTPTGTALITVAEGDNTIVVLPGANMDLAETDVCDLGLSPGDICCAQCEIPIKTVETFFNHARQSGAFTIFNNAPAKNLSDELLNLTDLLVVNEIELEFMIGTKVSVLNIDSIVQAAASLKLRGTRNLIVTLGAHGVWATISDQTHFLKAHSVTPLDTTGAGDCFVGALAARLSLGEPLEQALSFANAAAAISVTRKGAGPGMPEESEIRRFLKAQVLQNSI